MAAGDEWPHLERLRPGQRGTQVVPSHVDAGWIVLGGDEPHKALGIDLVAALAVVDGQAHGALGLNGGIAVATREEVHLAQMRDDGGPGAPSPHALGLRHRALDQLDPGVGAPGPRVDHAEVPRDRRIQERGVLAEGEAELEHGNGVGQPALAQERAAQRELGMGLAERVAGGLGDPNRLLGALHGLVELTQLGQAPREMATRQPPMRPPSTRSSRPPGRPR